MSDLDLLKALRFPAKTAGQMSTHAWNCVGHSPITWVLFNQPSKANAIILMSTHCVSLLCYVTNWHKFSGLRHSFILSVSVGQKSHLAQLRWVLSKTAVGVLTRAGFPSGGSKGEGSASKLMQGVGRICFLVNIELTVACFFKPFRESKTLEQI